jgi:solute carrier family 9B (sodium/hydrogen exchanger), member 1/2
MTPIITKFIFNEGGSMSFNIFLVLIIIGGWVAGKVFNKLHLPAILGMLFWGIILGNFFKNNVPMLLWEIEPTLKSLALIVILLRAGLGIKKQTLTRIGKPAFFMAFLPCVVEGAALTFVFYFLFKFEILVSAMTAFMISAVSPAVVVPSMLELKENNSHKNEVPTLILAGASADDVFAITLFSIFLNLIVSGDINIIKTIVSLPLSIIGGIILGYITGIVLSKYFKKNFTKIRATEKTIIILTLSVILVEIGTWIHLATFLTIMVCGFVILSKAEYLAKELSLKLSKIWILAEIFLFVLIGISVDIRVLSGAGFMGLFAILIGLLFRSIGVLISTHFSNLNFKERLFCVIAYIPKATVQAALGSIPLAYGIAEGDIILALAVLSIAFTAPLGIIGIKLGGKHLL